MTHIAFFDALWRHIRAYLVSSAPSDGRIYDIKCWVSSSVEEPLLEVMYRLGLTTEKPVAAYTTEDLLEFLEQDRDES